MHEPACLPCLPAPHHTPDRNPLRLPRANRQASAEHMRRQQELMKEIELRRKMKATVVPTNDADVRRQLRQLREPVTLFGEREVRWGGVGRQDCC